VTALSARAFIGSKNGLDVHLVNELSPSQLPKALFVLYLIHFHTFQCKDDEDDDGKGSCKKKVGYTRSFNNLIILGQSYCVSTRY
jgi:hypothetical protein